MASLSELSLRDRLFLLRYRYRTAETPDRLQAARPLDALRIALLTSAGIHHHDDPPFDPDVEGGDFSHRVIPASMPDAELVTSQRSDAWDRSGFEADVNTVFPRARLQELADEGRIGSTAPRHLSVQGSIPAPGRFLDRTVPAMLEVLREDRVDGIVLAPV